MSTVSNDFDDDFDVTSPSDPLPAPEPEESITLSPSQAEALYILEQSLQGRNTPPGIIVTGAAGTGKSTLLRTFLTRNIHRLQPICTAPTTCATAELKRILGSVRYKEQALEITTTQTALRMTIDTKSEHKTLKQVTPLVLQDNNYVTVDECSIIPPEIFNVLRDRRLPVLYSGHISQLPAVDPKTDRSVGIVFEQEEYRQIVLREPHRNAGDLAAYCELLERAIYKDIILPHPYLTWDSQVPKILDSQAEGLHDGTTQILAYTNARVNQYNQAVRRMLYGDKIPSIVPGDRMMTEDYSWKFLSPLQNQDSLKRTIYKKGKMTLPANTRFHVVEITEALVLTVLCYELKIHLEPHQGYIVGLSGFIYVPKNLIAYSDLKTKYYEEAKAATGVSAAKKWQEYHKLSSLFLFPRHCYATTVHNAQGRSIPNVIVDAGNIETCRNNTIKAKLRYVAASRASKKLWMIR